MPTSIAPNEIPVSKVTKVSFTADSFTFHLEDKRELTVPLWWYPRLKAGSPKQMENYRILPGATGVTWEDLDEDISVRGLLLGQPAPGAIPPVMDAAE